MKLNGPVRTRAFLLGLFALGALGCKADPAAENAIDRSMTTFGPSPTNNASPSSSESSPPPNRPATGSAGGTAGNASQASNAGAKSDAGTQSKVTADAGHDAGPPLPIECAGDDGGIEDSDAGNPRNCLVVSDLHVQYLAADTNASDNQSKPHFNLVNHGTRAQNLADLSIRYWFSDSSSIDFDFACDYAQIGCASIKAQFVTSDRPNANRYLELSFSSGSLSGGGQTGEIQARFNHKDWSNLDENDDYSFDAKKTSFTDWYKVTLYRAGVLVWGAEP